MANIDTALNDLNPEQLQAVTHTGSPLLILAGAGAGKTKVITTKIAYLIEHGVTPYKILAVTFTNKAAGEMKERAVQLAPASEQSCIKTFHSFGAWFLRMFYSGSEIANNFTVYDDDDSVALLKACFPATDKSTLHRWQKMISRAKDDFILPDDIDKTSKYASIAEAYRAYQTRLRATGNVDFGDLILLPTLCLKKNPDIKKHLHNYFSVIMVDEFQDTNVAQMELLKELTGDKTYLCVVGDDDQSIYKFRGASVENILGFQETFLGTQIIRLEKNYRSTPEILSAANSVIKNNNGRLGKTLHATRTNGIKPILFIEPNQTAEVERVIELLYNDVKLNKHKYSDWAILYRTNSQSRNFETMFLSEHIPYQVIGSLRFYEREEIKDGIALLSFLLNERDEIALRRIINKPARGIGEKSLSKVLQILYIAEQPAPEKNSAHLELDFGEDDEISGFYKKIESLSLSKKATAAVTSFFRNAIHLRQILKTTGHIEANTIIKFSSGLSGFVAAALEKSGLAEYYQMHDDEQKLGNLQELVNMAINYDYSESGLAEFLESLSLNATAAEDEDTADAVKLITVHGTKGLEFDNVVITGLEENIFPITRSDEAADIEEERRLMYVAITRAKNRLFMTAAKNRIWNGKPSEMELSRFIREIEPDMFTVKNYADQYVRTEKKRTSLNDFPKVIRLEKKAKPPKEDKNQKWRKGTIVYSDDFGYGKVTSVDMIDDTLTFEVRFESGKRQVYFPAYRYVPLEIVQDYE